MLESDLEHLMMRESPVREVRAAGPDKAKVETFVIATQVVALLMYRTRYGLSYWLQSRFLQIELSVTSLAKL